MSNEQVNGFFTKKNLLILTVAVVLIVGTLGGVLIYRQLNPAPPLRTPGDKILVTPQWLFENLDSVTILDATRSADQFAEGHIPGAALVTRQSILGTVNGIGGMLPDPVLVAQDLADAGVFADKPVVVYDGGNGLWASRLFWTLEYLGHTRVHLLDGGVEAWKNGGYDLATAAQIPPRGDFTANLQPELIADSAYILEHLSDGTIGILDARSPEEFAGTNVQADRGGHIPNSVNIDWRLAIGEDTSFLPLSALTELYAESAQEDLELVTLCQTGIRGAHTYVALRILGHDQVRLYDGSWTEWGNDPELPVQL